MAHLYNPNTWEAETGVLRFKTSLGYRVRPCLQKKKKKERKKKRGGGKTVLVFYYRKQSLHGIYFPFPTTRREDYA
jgi:hypothetical protein